MKNGVGGWWGKKAGVVAGSRTSFDGYTAAAAVESSGLSWKKGEVKGEEWRGWVGGEEGGGRRRE